MSWLKPLYVAMAFWATTAAAFQGRITIAITSGGQTQTLLYTVGTNDMRIECRETDRPYTRNIVNLDSGAVTILFPHNRSFVRLNPTQADQSVANRPGVQAPASLPGAPAFNNRPDSPPAPGPGNLTSSPVMPRARPMMMEQADLKATEQVTNLLGISCKRYEIRGRGEVMEIWATNQLLPFQPYLQNQPHRFGPRTIEDQWGELLKSKKLFPLLAVLTLENGPERMRFEVKSVTPEQIKSEEAQKLFQVPPDYQETNPLPF